MKIKYRMWTVSIESKHRKASMSHVMLDKVNFKRKSIISDKEYFYADKMVSSSERNCNPNMYVSRNRALKHIKQKDWWYWKET